MVGLDDSLRVAQVVLHVITVCGGLMTSIGLGWTVNILGENCLLYTNMVLKQGKNKTISIDYDETEWANVEICYYCMFSSVTAAIYAIIWFWFYLLLSDWNTSGTDLNFKRFTFHRPRTGEATEKVPPPDLKLFVPTLIINMVLFICSTVSLGLITRGSNEWCKSVSLSLGTHIQCSYLRKVEWNTQYGYLVYTYLKIAQAGSWVLLLSVLGKIVIVGSRLHLYFRLDDPEKSNSNKSKSIKDKKKTVINEPAEVVLRHSKRSSSQSSESSDSYTDFKVTEAAIHKPSAKDYRNTNTNGDTKNTKSNGDTIEKKSMVKFHTNNY